MQVWSQAATLAKNSLSNDGVFLIFLEINNKLISEPIRLVRDTQDQTWQDKLWTRFPLSIETSGEDGKTIPSLQIKISNVGGIVQTYIQNYNGLVDSEVKIMVAYSQNLSNPNPEFELDYLVTETTYDSQWITFTLGASSELSNRYPECKYVSNYCKYVCKDVRCGYTGTETCENTLASCKIPERFGGFPGMVD